MSVDGEQVKDTRKTYTREELTGEGKVIKRGKKNFMKVIAK